MAALIVRFIACMPVSSSDEIIGAIKLMDRKPKRFAAYEIALLQTISKTTAIHVDASIRSESEGIK